MNIVHVPLPKLNAKVFLNIKERKQKRKGEINRKTEAE
jgi:hypothetical protein